MAGPAVGTQVLFSTAEETTYGTPVVVNRGYEILSETLERRNRILTSNGLRGGTRNLRRGSRRVLSARDAGGTVTMEVPTTTFGRWLKHLMGGTPTIVQQGGTPAWLQTHAMGDLTGKSLTVQKQLRSADGVVVSPFTLHGTKVLAGEFSIGVDEILTCALDLDAEDIDTSTAAAAVTYSNVSLFHFAQGTLKVAGSAVASVLSATTRIENPLKVDRYYLGSAGLKKEPTDNDFPAVTGSLSAEFNSAADFYNRFAADSAAELILEFEGAVISGAEKELLRITVPDVRFTGGTPQVGGPDVVVQDVPYEGAFNGTNAGATIEYKSTDTAI